MGAGSWTRGKLDWDKQLDLDSSPQRFDLVDSKLKLFVMRNGQKADWFESGDKHNVQPLVCHARLSFRAPLLLVSTISLLAASCSPLRWYCTGNATNEML